MRKLGLIGGMSWQSTVVYYSEINRLINARLGGQHSADLMLCSLDFASVAGAQHEGRWEDAGRPVCAAAARLSDAGADAILICTNTMHKVFAAVQAATEVPILHIGDSIGRSAAAQGYDRLLVLGTRFTMEQPFLTSYLEQNFGLACQAPAEADREEVHRIIYQELCQGVVDGASRQAMKDVIARGAEGGAQAVVLACTELGLLIDQGNSPLPVLDSTLLHCADAVAFALEGRV